MRSLTVFAEPDALFPHGRIARELTTAPNPGGFAREGHYAVPAKM